MAENKTDKNTIERQLLRITYRPIPCHSFLHTLHVSAIEHPTSSSLQHPLVQLRKGTGESDEAQDKVHPPDEDHM